MRSSGACADDIVRVREKEQRRIRICTNEQPVKFFKKTCLIIKLYYFMLQAVMATLEHGDKSLDTKQSFFSGIQFIPSAHMGHKIIRIWLKILLTGIGKSSPELKTCKLICWILFVKIFKALRWTFHDPYKQAFKVRYFSTNKKRSSCFPAQLSLTLWWHFSVRSKGQVRIISESDGSAALTERRIFSFINSCSLCM